jgi:rare lipoprotein A
VKPAGAAGFTCEASWYGPGFIGNSTASGAVYTGEAGTAAHPYYPFGTVLYVESLYSGNSGYVTITDRGPYAAGRCLDVSWGSNYLVDYGVAEIYYEIVYWPTTREGAPC